VVIDVHANFPNQQGLYHPAREHDSCGVAFIAKLKGEPQHQIVKDALLMLCNMTHRGAVSADPESGDGAGILLQIPFDYFKEIIGFPLPPAGDYACGNIFFQDDQNKKEIQKQKFLIEKEIAYCGLELCGWRELPINDQHVGTRAKNSEPWIEQLFVSRGLIAIEDFEFALYRARRRIEKHFLPLYICSLSSQSIVYKGMLLAKQLEVYFDDLKNAKVKSTFALVHQRFSTNTFPSWQLAHPYRICAHNGEFNTIQGNINAMRTRESNMSRPDLSKEVIEDLKPIIFPNQSDSAAFDNALELGAADLKRRRS
jgi:glutamate synthase (NADPH) large chain